LKVNVRKAKMQFFEREEVLRKRARNEQRERYSLLRNGFREHGPIGHSK
jgi:hypothetical protein